MDWPYYPEFNHGIPSTSAPCAGCNQRILGAKHSFRKDRQLQELGAVTDLVGGNRCRADRRKRYLEGQGRHDRGLGDDYSHYILTRFYFGTATLRRWTGIPCKSACIFDSDVGSFYLRQRIPVWLGFAEDKSPPLLWTPAKRTHRAEYPSK